MVLINALSISVLTGKILFSGPTVKGLANNRPIRRFSRDNSVLYLLNKSSLGYILSFHDLSPEVFKYHIQSLNLPIL